MRKKENIESILEGRDYAHAVVSKKDTGDKSYDTAKMLAIANLIEHMLGKYGRAKSIIIDGTQDDEVIRLLGKEFRPAEINAFPYADSHYRSVNIADRISYQLFTYYNAFNDMRQAKKYKENRIGLNFADYNWLVGHLDMIKPPRKSSNGKPADTSQARGSEHNDFQRKQWRRSSSNLYIRQREYL